MSVRPALIPPSTPHPTGAVDAPKAGEGGRRWLGVDYCRRDAGRRDAGPLPHGGPVPGPRDTLVSQHTHEELVAGAHCAGRLRRPSFLRSSRIASVTDRPCALRCNGCEPSDACMRFRTLLRSGRPMAGLDLWRCMPPQRRLSRRRHLQRAQRGDVRRSSRGCRRRKGSGIGKGWRKWWRNSYMITMTMMTLRDNG